MNILRSISIVTVIALGVTLSLAAGGFDLSVGSVASLSDTVVLSAFVWFGWSSPVAMLAAVFAGLIVGAANAFLVVKVRIPDMLATLSTMFIVQGVATTYSSGGSITENMAMTNGSTAAGHIPPGFSALGQVPAIIIAMIALVAALQVFLSFTKPGRVAYAVGGNREAARLSGIGTGRVRTASYLVSAAFASVGGILLASRIGSAQVGAGSAYLMDAVAAAYIGYSFGGAGKPNAIGTFAGAVLIGILQNGLVMLSVPYFAMDIVKGAVLVIALALTYFYKHD